MTALARYHAANLPDLMEKIKTNGIFMDDYFDRFFNETTTNYPPYNLVQVSNTQSRLEVSLAGFKKKEVKVYTEYGKLTIEANVDEKVEATFLHRGLARRSFTRSWAIPDDTEVREVKFTDGLLTVELGKVVPEHHARKDYL